MNHGHSSLYRWVLSGLASLVVFSSVNAAEYGWLALTHTGSSTVTYRVFYRMQGDSGNWTGWLYSNRNQTAGTTQYYPTFAGSGNDFGMWRVQIVFEIYVGGDTTRGTGTLLGTASAPRVSTLGTYGTGNVYAYFTSDGTVPPSESTIEITFQNNSDISQKFRAVLDQDGAFTQLWEGFIGAGNDVMWGGTVDGDPGNVVWLVEQIRHHPDGGGTYTDWVPVATVPHTSSAWVPGGNTSPGVVIGWSGVGTGSYTGDGSLLPTVLGEGLALDETLRVGFEALYVGQEVQLEWNRLTFEQQRAHETAVREILAWLEAGNPLMIDQLAVLEELGLTMGSLSDTAQLILPNVQAMEEFLDNLQSLPQQLDSLAGTIDSQTTEIVEGITGLEESITGVDGMIDTMTGIRDGIGDLIAQGTMEGDGPYDGKDGSDGEGMMEAAEDHGAEGKAAIEAFFNIPAPASGNQGTPAIWEIAMPHPFEPIRFDVSNSAFASVASWHRDILTFLVCMGYIIAISLVFRQTISEQNMYNQATSAATVPLKSSGFAFVMAIFIVAALTVTPAGFVVWMVTTGEWSFVANTISEGITAGATGPLANSLWLINLFVPVDLTIQMAFLYFLAIGALTVGVWVSGVATRFLHG